MLSEVLKKQSTIWEEKKITKNGFILKDFLFKGFKCYNSEKVLNILDFKQKYFQEKVGT